MVASGAQANEVEASLRRVLDAYDAPQTVVMVSYTSVTVSYVAEDSAEATTAAEVVRRWEPGYHRLVAAADLAEAISRGDIALTDAEELVAELTASAYALTCGNTGHDGSWVHSVRSASRRSGPSSARSTTAPDVRRS